MKSNCIQNGIFCPCFSKDSILWTKTLIKISIENILDNLWLNFLNINFVFSQGTILDTGQRCNVATSQTFNIPLIIQNWSCYVLNSRRTNLLSSPDSRPRGLYLGRKCGLYLEKKIAKKSEIPLNSAERNNKSTKINFSNLKKSFNYD